MKNEVSVLVLDISDASRSELGNEVNHYFEEIKINISLWTQYLIPTKVLHVTNRELIILSNAYASSFLLAFYIQLIWKYKDHPLYSGLSFGNIDEDVTSIDLESWNAPILLEAKRAKDIVKENANDKKFHFSLVDLPDATGIHNYKQEVETMLNTILDLMHELRNRQTDIQSLVCSLYAVFDRQNKVSKYLDRTKSTISTHIRNGKTIAILNAFQQIVNVLHSVQQQSDKQKIIDLEKNMKRNIAQHAEIHFPKK